MIELFMWTTGNGRKGVMALEEMGLPYRARPVNILKGEQFDDAFLAISPNNKIPAIVDDDGPHGARISVFESAAVLFYLAEKSGKLLAPSGTAGRHKAMEWLAFSVAGIGPAIGQLHYFTGPGKETGNDAVVARFRNETQRVIRVLDRRLAETEWLAGGDYSIADISAYCRARGYAGAGLADADVPHVADWCARIEARAASKRAERVIDEVRAQKTPLDDAARSIMYGEAQFAKR